MTSRPNPETVNPTLSSEFEEIYQLSRDDQLDRLRDWPPHKWQQCVSWLLDDCPLDLARRNAAKHDAYLAAEKHEQPVSPTGYVGLLKNLNFSNEQAVPNFIKATQKIDYGPLPKPIPLFSERLKNGELQYFYLCSEYLYFRHHTLNELESEDEVSSESQDEGTAYSTATNGVTERGPQYGYLKKFNPALQAHIDPRYPLEGSYTDDPLVYGLLLGTLRHGSKNILDAKDLFETPFLVFLHIHDKSIWLVFDQYLKDEYGDFLGIRDLRSNSIWQLLGYDPVNAIRCPPLHDADHQSRPDEVKSPFTNGIPEPKVFGLGFVPRNGIMDSKINDISWAECNGTATSKVNSLHFANTNGATHIVTTNGPQLQAKNSCRNHAKQWEEAAVPEAPFVDEVKEYLTGK